MDTVLITGGSGIVGSALIPELIQRGYKIHVLSRSQKNIPNVQVFTWDIDKELIQEGALIGVEHIIHLAGYSVSEGRWNKRRKKLIEDSRIKSIAILKEHLQEQKLKSFISASGVSIYGTKTTNEIFQENDTPLLEASDYLGRVSQRWEKATDQIKQNSERLIIMRTPVVLSRTGGALEKIASPIRKGFGAALGTGRQYMPWVHIDDLVSAYILALETEDMSGTFNVSAAEHITNKEFTKAVAHALNKKLWMPSVPSFVLKLMFGQMANIILKGSRASGERIKNSGLQYKFQSLDAALKDLL